MKILLTVHQFLPKYSSGTEVLTYETAKALLDRGHDVRVLTAEPVERETALNNAYLTDQYNNITVYRLHYHDAATSNPVRAEYYNTDNKKTVENLMRDFKPDIVHIMHCYRLSATIIDVFHNLNIPVIVTATDFWLICPYAQLKLPNNKTCIGPDLFSMNCLKCFVSKTQPRAFRQTINRLPKILLVLLGVSARFRIIENWDKGVMFRAIVRRQKYMLNQIKKVNKIIAPTDIMSEILASNGVDKNKIIKLPYGINYNGVRQRKPNKYRGMIKFAFIGTLYEHKGVHILIKAFTELKKKYHSTELKIYGDVTQFPKYTHYLKKLSAGVGNLYFLGTFPNAEIEEIFEDIDVLVVPSIWYENTPLVIYSAFQTKTPVIATNLGGMSEVVRHNINGLLFEKEDPASLMERMERFLQQPKLLAKLSSGIQQVKSIEENVRELEELYVKCFK
ncbi:MAG: glycosyltransferase family 4 protein [Bacillota bacterium]|nr:glycosyltransferase family 4 protein [Bacillota bacterium]